jgi:hypothetical protein
MMGLNRIPLEGFVHDFPPILWMRKNRIRIKRKLMFMTEKLSYKRDTRAKALTITQSLWLNL